MAAPSQLLPNLVPPLASFPHGRGSFPGKEKTNSIQGGAFHTLSSTAEIATRILLHTYEVIRIVIRMGSFWPLWPFSQARPYRAAPSTWFLSCLILRVHVDHTAPKANSVRSTPYRVLRPLDGIGEQKHRKWKARPGPAISLSSPSRLAPSPFFSLFPLFLLLPASLSLKSKSFLPRTNRAVLE